MIKYNKVFRGEFYTQEVDPVTNLALDTICTVDIYDTTSGEADDPTEIIELPMADQPVIYESVDNDEDKIATVIRSLRATVNIHSSDTIGIETFVDGGDSRFFGHIYLGGDGHVIKGFVSVADVQEDFQPDPNIISLIISDGLGFADDEELTDEDGNIPMGIHDVWYYLRLAFLKTGQSCDAIVVFNIREKFASTLNDTDSHLGHFFKYCYLDARTFEGSDPGTMISAKEVIEKICFGCLVSQFDGRWLILNIDEIQSDADLNLFNVDEAGVFINGATTDFSKLVGEGNDLSWMDDNAIVSTERPVKKYILKRIYEYFKEIPCNIDFERGEGSDPTGAADETIDYALECWSFLREGSAPVDLDSAPFAGSTGVLRKRFESNYEKDRYLVNGVAGGFRHYFKSEGIRMAEKSKINIGFQWRSATDTAAVTMNVAHMRLVGDDGNVYDWNLTTAGVSSWVQKIITATVFDTTWQANVNGIDESEWQSISATSQIAPVSGTLYIRLLNDLSTPQRHFNTLKVTYTPLINNSYAKYTGESHIIEQDTDAKAKREEEINIGSGPDFNIKGTLQKRGADIELFSGVVDFGNFHDIQITGDHRPTFQAGMQIVVTGSALNNIEGEIVSVGYSIIGNLTTIITDQLTTLEAGATVVISKPTYELATLFYNAAVLPDGPPDDSVVHPYGELISFNVWNQYNRVMRMFDGKIDGLDSGHSSLGFIHKYKLTDVNANTLERVFMLLHINQDIHLCEATVHFHEVHDPENPKQYLGHSFKFLTQ